MSEIPVPPPKNSTPTSRLVTILGFVVATAILYLAKGILIPIALAILISFLLSPLVYWLERSGLKRVIAVVLVVLTLMSLVGGLGYLIVGQFVDFVDNLPSYRTNIVQKIHAVKPGEQSVLKRAEAAFEDISREVGEETTGTATRSGRTTGAALATTETTTTAEPPLPAPEPQTQDIRDEAVDEVLFAEDESAREAESRSLDLVAQLQTGQPATSGEAVPVRVMEGPPNTWQTFQEIVGPVIVILGNAGLVILFVIFFLIQREDLRDRVLRLAGQKKVRVTTEALEEAASRVSRYLLMQLIINVTYGIPVAIGLWFIGLPNPLLWGALATILRFIPYVGPWLAAAMPVTLSLAVFDTWTLPLVIIAMFITLEIFSNNFMEPILYGQSTGISPVAIIAAAVFWTWLWGAVGLVLATPITVCLVVLGRYIPQLAFLRVLLGDEPVLTEDARIYNRLLSGATDEAVEIAEDYVEQHDLPSLYDNVLLPALESAETDRSEDMLSASRYDHLITGMNELLEAVTDKYLASEEEQDQITTGEGEGEHQSDYQAPSVVPQRKIACIPVNDVTDQTAASMLRGLVAGKELEVMVLNAGMLASEVVEELRDFNPDVILLSSVPPFAVTHTRYLAKRMAAEFPDARLYAGLWRGDNTLQKADERLKLVGVSKVFTQLKDAALHL